MFGDERDGYEPYAACCWVWYRGSEENGVTACWCPCTGGRKNGTGETPSACDDEKGSPRAYLDELANPAG